MTTAEPHVLRDELFVRLVGVAEKLRTPRRLADHDLAVAFLGVGIELARASAGPVSAAEWLRDVADEIEKGALAGPARDGSA